MNIVHYLAGMRLEEGGVVRAVLDLCGALAERGHDIRVLTFDALDAPDSWKLGQPGCPQVVTLARRAGPLPRLSRSGVREARASIDRADVVHLHVPWDTVCLRLGRLARQSGKPYLVGIHGMLDDWCMEQKTLKKRLYLALGGRRLLEQAAAVHCTAEAERGQSSKWYPRGNPVVVPLICDLEPYRKLPGPELARKKFAKAFAGSDDPVVLFLSRLHPKKGLEPLMEAAARLRDQGTRFRLLIAGSGDASYEESLRRFAEGNSLVEQVIFLGFVSGQEKVSLYQAADVFVLPTSQENWGFVLIEALACGTPVVTTRGVDIWPELDDSGGSVLVEAISPAIAATIAGLLSDPPRRQRMGEAGRAWVLEHLDTDHVVGRYERMYEETAGDGAP